MEFKQCIVVREDLKLSAGKLAVQVAHAAVMAVERAEKMDKSVVSDWKREGQKKVILKVAGVPRSFQGPRGCRTSWDSQRYCSRCRPDRRYQQVP